MTTLKDRFKNERNRANALVKIWFVWADSDQPYTQYSRPECDKKGVDYAEKRTIGYYTQKLGKKIKHQRILVYDNQTGRLRGEYIQGKKQ